jgi:hypothetical protein
MIKLSLIVLGLLATTGVVYAACMFCLRRHHSGLELHVRLAAIIDHQYTYGSRWFPRVPRLACRKDYMIFVSVRGKHHGHRCEK